MANPKSHPSLFPIIIALAAFFASFQTILDPDLGWHLLTGQHTLTTHSIPRTDLFSFSHPNYPYIYHSWATEVILFLFYQALSFWGVSLLYSLLFSFSFFFLAHTNPTRTPPLLTLSLFLFIHFTVNIVSLRTRVLSFFFLALTHFIVSRFLYSSPSKPKRLLWLLPICFLFWSNLHGGFISGLGYLFLTLTTHSLLHLTNQPETSLSKIKTLSFITFLSFFATLINPYGLNLHRFTFRMAINPTANQYNLDWVPVYQLNCFHHKLGFFIIATLFFILLLKKSTLPSQKIILSVYFCLIFLTSRFYTPLLVILLPLIPNLVQPFYHHFRRQSPTQLFPIRLGLLFSLGFFFIHTTNTLSATHTAYSSPDHYSQASNFLLKYPYGAIKHLKINPAPPNLLNNMNWGGYLLLYFPNQKIFADGKMDNYFTNGVSFLKIYTDTILAKPGWSQTLNHYSINSVLLPPEYPLIQTLKSNPNWKLTYQDEFSTLLIRQPPLPL